MQKSIIKFEDVSFGYNSEKVLKNINFEINKADLLGILGSNGSGKTTLIRLLIGSLIPSIGKVTILDSNPKNICDSHHIGYVSQSSDKNKSTFPATVLEIVMMNLYSQVGFLKFFNHNQKKSALDALEKVGMQDFKDRLISELSGGQRQRVMIAKAIVNNPEILILDEPTTGVDEEASKRIYNLIAKLNKDYSITVVIISHDIKNIDWLCNVKYEIEYGKIKPHVHCCLC